MAKKRGNQIGSWAFLIGLVIAVVLGIFTVGELGSGLLTTLVILGLVVGLLNVGDEEVQPFLMSGVVLIIASAFGGNILANVPYVGQIFSALLVLFVPATIIVAVKNVFQIARN